MKVIKVSGQNNQLRTYRRRPFLLTSQAATEDMNEFPRLVWHQQHHPRERISFSSPNSCFTGTVAIQAWSNSHPGPADYSSNVTASCRQEHWFCWTDITLERLRVVDVGLDMQLKRMALLVKSIASQDAKRHSGFRTYCGNSRCHLCDSKCYVLLPLQLTLFPR